jgi:hypothetical protein
MNRAWVGRASFARGGELVAPTDISCPIIDSGPTALLTMVGFADTFPGARADDHEFRTPRGWPGKAAGPTRLELRYPESAVVPARLSREAAMRIVTAVTRPITPASVG